MPALTHSCDRTRFFAAAALLNTAFARLFGLLSVVHAPCSFSFLNEVGAALEIDNIDYARSITTRAPGAKIVRVLREVRGQVGRELEFGAEAHRVRIGLTLIEHIRNEA